MARARQGDLFAGTEAGPLASPDPSQQLPLLREQLLAWQQRLAQHQGPLFMGTGNATDRLQQGQLFAMANPVEAAADRFQPLML